MTNAKYSTGQLENIIFTLVNTLLMIILVLITLYPFLNTLAVSLNEGTDTIRGGIYLLPRAWTLQNYQAVFATGTILNAFTISVLRTVISTVLNVFLTSMLAYTLSRSSFIFRKLITTTFVLTMYFNAGLIPHFFLIKNLGLYGNFLVYIFPSLISAFNLIVVRTYIRTIPESIIESAKMDGAGDFLIFIKLIFPLCKPILATIALFVAVGAWNTWFDTFLYCSSKPELSTLQYELMKILSQTFQTAKANVVGFSADDLTSKMLTPKSMQAAITIVTAVPILFIYPFLQKYFIVGLNVGSVKE